MCMLSMLFCVILWNIVEPGVELLIVLQQQTQMLYTTPISVVGSSNHSQSVFDILILSLYVSTFLQI